MTGSERLLSLTNLTVDRFGRSRHALDHVSIGVDAHETVVLLGEAGAGPDTLMQVLSGTLEDGHFVGGEIRYGAPSGGPQFAPRPVRKVYLPGPAASPLSPHASAASQLSRVIARNLSAPYLSGRTEFAQALGHMAGAPQSSAFEKRTGELAPDILAWGLLAAALAQTPDLLLVDNFFEGLAPRPARALEDALLAAKERLGCAILCATMNTETAVRLGGRLIVMRRGRVVEEGPMPRLASDQAHAYTRTLFSESQPRERGALRGQPVVQILGLGLDSGSGAKDELNFELRRGAALALVGEEGSGRRRLVRQILGLERVKSGRIVFDAIDIGILSTQMMSRLRRRVALVEGADDVLDPRMTLWETVAEPLRAHLHLPRDLVATYREAALRRVGLASLPGHLTIGELSTFDRRRLQVARAIVTAPVLAVIDEPFRGLDAFAQSVIRDLLQSFRAEESPAFLVVTSDFAVARALADEALVFHDGRIVERGPISELLQAPKDAQSRMLVEASRLGLRSTLSPTSPAV